MNIRAFIAVNLPQETKQELGNWVTEVRKNLFAWAHSHCRNARSGTTSVKARYSDAIKWVNPNNFHLTLHFLGYLEEKQLEQVKTILQSSVFKTDIVLKIKKLDCFPNQDRPRVLFFKCEEKGSNNLINLQQIIGQALEHIGMEIDNRVWQTHLTFARVKMPIKLPNSFNKKIPDLEFKVKSIDLMKSDLSRQGPEYTILNKYLLL